MLDAVGCTEAALRFCAPALALAVLHELWRKDGVPAAASLSCVSARLGAEQAQALHALARSAADALAEAAESPDPKLLKADLSRIKKGALWNVK